MFGLSQCHPVRSDPGKLSATCLFCLMKNTDCGLVSVPVKKGTNIWIQLSQFCRKDMGVEASLNNESAYFRQMLSTLRTL